METPTAPEEVVGPQGLAAASGKEQIVIAEYLTKRFGEQTAIEGVSFSVPDGTIFGFIGPSGCGKTTTVRLLTGIYMPSDGKVSVMGKDPTRFRKAERERIGYLPQQFVFYPDLTVEENLNFAASLYGVPLVRGRRLKRLLDFVELTDHRRKKASDISGGMARRLSLAATLVHDPRLLFLDEPTAGIDPILRQKVWDYFQELKGEGKTMFVTTQYVGEAAYCDYVGVMSMGKLMLVDTPEGLRHQAFGGDVVDMRLTTPIPYSDRQQLGELPFVAGFMTSPDDRSVRIITDDASKTMPELMDWSRNKQLEVESIEEYLPPFDDVFVKLVKEYEREVAQ